MTKEEILSRIMESLESIDNAIRMIGAIILIILLVIAGIMIIRGGDK